MKLLSLYRYACEWQLILLMNAIMLQNYSR